MSEDMRTYLCVGIPVCTCVCVCVHVHVCVHIWVTLSRVLLFNHLGDISNVPLKFNMKGNLLYFFSTSVRRDRGKLSTHCSAHYLRRQKERRKEGKKIRKRKKEIGKITMKDRLNELEIDKMRD